MLIMLCSVVIISSFVLGVGFRKEIGIYPGQVYTENLKLQNLAPGTPTLVYQGTIIEGSEVISFEKGDKFTVENGKIVEAPLRVKAPVGASVGDRYTVKMVWTSYPANPEASSDSDGGGAVQFVTGVGISFEVVVVEKPVQPEKAQTTTTTASGGSNTLVWVIGVILIILIVWWLIKRKK